MTYEEWSKGFPKNYGYLKEEEDTITEMCDVCGKSFPAPLFRKRYDYKKGLAIVIRHCYYCNPDIRFNYIIKS